MPLKYPFALLLAMLPAYAFEACAGASLFVDDAAVTPRGRCQVETWVRTDFPGHEATVVPACNVGGTEFGVGISHYGHPAYGPVFNLGAKHVFHGFDAHGWGIGVSLGTAWNSEHRNREGWNLNVPVSFALDPQHRTVVHANVRIGRESLRKQPNPA